MSLSPKWRIARNGLVALVAIVLACVAGVTILNSYDERPSPGAVALLVRDLPPPQPDQNLYLALLGFQRAQKGGSIIESGQSVVDAYQAKLTAPTTTRADSKPKPIARTDQLKFVGEASFCKPISSSCLDKWQVHAAAIAKLTDDNRELYDRYLALRRYHHYVETASPSFTEPWGYVPSSVRNLYIANLVIQMHAVSNSDRQAAIHDLCSDIAMWRLILVTQSALLAKMIAIANLHADFGLMADMLADPAVDDSDFNSPEFESVISADTDWRIGNAFIAEFQMAHQWYGEMSRRSDGQRGDLADEGTSSSWWDRRLGQIENHFFKAQASDNLDALEMEQLRQLGDSNPAEFSHQLASWHEWQATHFEPFRLEALYNPLGQWTLGMGATLFDYYPIRAQDLAAFERAVKLAYEIRMNRIGEKDVPAYIASRPELSSYPAAGIPLSWDAARYEISVHAVDTNFLSHRFTIAVWRSHVS